VGVPLSRPLVLNDRPEGKLVAAQVVVPTLPVAENVTFVIAAY
jgi:hypothetical protein